MVSQLLLGSGVGSTLLDGLPLDRIQFESGGGTEGSDVAIGAELLRGVTVYYTRDLGAGESGARVVWRFRRRWMLQSQVEEETGAAADLIWTYEF